MIVLQGGRRLENLPDPLIPAEVNVGDAPTPLILETGFGLDMEPNDRVFRAVVNLMAWSWKQKPTGSLPALKDSRRFANVAFVSAGWWAKHGGKVMSYFTRCSDGRWYHPDMSQQAMKIWTRRIAISTKYGLKNGEWQALRLRVLERDEYTCTYCGTTDKALDCDHVIPVSRGGKTTETNLVAACYSCNRSKGARLPSEWLQ